MRKIWTLGVLALIGAGLSAAYLVSQGNHAEADVLAGPVGGAATADKPAMQLVQAETTAEDRFIGEADAPVTMIEFASLTCSHCATFHTETLPKLKKHYIDTGKVKLVFRDFPLDRLSLVAAVLAQCAAPERYFGVIDMLFRDQQNWSRAQDPMASLRRIGRMAGLGDQQFDGCMKNEKLIDAIVAKRQKASKEYDVSSTPTFVINGEKVSGALPFEAFDKILKPLVPDS